MRVLLPLSKKSNSNGEEEEDDEEYDLEYYSDEESELGENDEVEQQQQDYKHYSDGLAAAAPTSTAIVAPAIIVAEPSLPAPQESSLVINNSPAVSSSISESRPTAATDPIVSFSSSSSPAIAPPVTENHNSTLAPPSSTTFSPPPVHHHLPNEEPAEQKLPGVCSIKRKEPWPSEFKPAAAAARISSPTPTVDSSLAAAAPTPSLLGHDETVVSVNEKRHSTRTESKKRTSRQIITSDDRNSRKKKPPPSSSIISSSTPTTVPAAVAAAATLPASASTSTPSLELDTSTTNMTAPRNYKDDDDDEENVPQVRNSNHHGGYYVEENEPPPVYDPNPVPSVARAAASSATSTHAAAASAGPVASEPASNARGPLASHSNYNRKMSASKKAAVPPAAASMLQDPTVDNHADDNNSGVDAAFCAALKRQGLELVVQEGDGNCLFRAVSLQVYGDASMHGQVREQCLDFMAANGDHFGQFVTGEAFADYVKRKRRLGVHGNNPEIQAISELFNRPVQVYVEDAHVNNNHSTSNSPTNSQGHLVPMNIFQTGYKTSDAPIRLSYHDGNHYNAVIDPLLPTAGLGLGLPGLRPGLADQLQVASAKVESDITMDLERAVKESREEQLKGQEDELQRALKESSYSMDTVSKTLLKIMSSTLRTIARAHFGFSHPFLLCRCTNTRPWHCRTWMLLISSWNKQR
jgi:OTU-like cysteine protease